ncbi:RNA ligase family protein, partial [Luteimonas sp. SMYT11W]
VEEKLDGANLGFSLSSKKLLQIQNRGSYFEAPFTGQFSRLRTWLPLHEEQLIEGLSPNLIAFCWPEPCGVWRNNAPGFRQRIRHG